MGTSLDLMQDLQDAYASLCNLTIFTTDSNGELITRPSNITPLSKLLLEGDDLSFSVRIRNALANFSQITKPILYEMRPGLKFILASVRTGDKTQYYIGAGVIIEEHSRELIKDYFNTSTKDPVQWKEALDTLGETSALSKEVLLEHIDKMALILSLHLKAAERKQKLGIINDVSTLITQPNSTIPHVLEKFLLFKEIDFVGFAENVDNELFRVSHMLGENALALAGASFSTGEGFLGHVAATGQLGFWGNIARDPRTLFFTQKDIYPNLLFCWPVRREAKVSGLLFGGSYTSSVIQPDVLSFGQTIARLLEVQLTNRSLQEDRNNHILRLSALMEICQVMTVVDDLKRILLILVDMSLNLVQGSFSCVVLKQRDKESKVQIVSRGLDSEQIDHYTQDLFRRHLSSKSAEKNHFSENGVHETDWGTAVIESPLKVNNEIQGFLCVGLRSQKEMDEFQALLSSLTTIGGMAIQRVQEAAGLNQINQLVITLHRAMKQWNREDYELTLRAKELVVSFSRYLGLPATEITHIANASLLFRYELDFLNETLPSQELMNILQEFSNFAEESDNKPMGNASCGIGSQILYLVWRYLSHGEQPEFLDQITYMNRQLLENFKAFLLSREVVDREVSIRDQGPTADGESDPLLMQRMKESMPLTSREQEVLHLVVQGLSNREIAEKLYISEHTVKNHMSNMFQKLGVSDRTQVIAMVYQSGYGKTQ
ncbi:LuxR C-terminal-related transcriptional regulator [Effusibacillus consociatus]|uniref:LuxR C-terminal-related transcriptional regulator n=1 Tax=Effusibacillus consociatus TaxID=1117041 RepID=A0ABV9Q5X7_9BACL